MITFVIVKTLNFFVSLLTLPKYAKSLHMQGMHYVYRLIHSSLYLSLFIVIAFAQLNGQFVALANKTTIEPSKQSQSNQEDNPYEQPKQTRTQPKRCVQPWQMTGHGRTAHACTHTYTHLTRTHTFGAFV